jgi:hypothetical protein
MANKNTYRGSGFGMTKAPDPPKNQPKATSVKGNDLRSNDGCKKGK